MKQRNENFTVGELAKHSGVSVRTLHHYDSTGLLKPAAVAANGYRHYGWAEALRLQEIMFYRELGLSLKEIERVLAEPTDVIERLQYHRKRLQQQAERTVEMLKTLDETIAHLKGTRTMKVDELYKPFDPEKQAAYEELLVQRHGPDMAESIATSKAAIAAQKGGVEGALTKLKSVEMRLVAHFEKGILSDSGELYEALESQRALMTEFWGRECDADGMEGLAETYGSHPDFVARYETLGTGFSSWLISAMKAHAGRLRTLQ